MNLRAPDDSNVVPFPSTPTESAAEPSSPA